MSTIKKLLKPFKCIRAAFRLVFRPSASSKAKSSAHPCCDVVEYVSAHQADVQEPVCQDSCEYLPVFGRLALFILAGALILSNLNACTALLFTPTILPKLTLHAPRLSTMTEFEEAHLNVRTQALFSFLHGAEKPAKKQYPVNTILLLIEQEKEAKAEARRKARAEAKFEALVARKATPAPQSAKTESTDFRALAFELKTLDVALFVASL